MRKLLCLLGFHEWSAWSLHIKIHCYNEATNDWRHRQCRNCGKDEFKNFK